MRPLVVRALTALRGSKAGAGAALGAEPRPYRELPIPEGEADGVAVWRIVARELPDTIAPIPERHLVASPLAEGLSIPGVTVKGSFGSGSWLFLDRRHSRRINLKISAKSAPQERSRVVVVQAGSGLSEGRVVSMNIRIAGGDAFVACGHVRRFPSVITIGHGGWLEIGDMTSTAGIEIKLTQGLVSIGRDCQIGGGTKVLALHYHGVVDLTEPAPRLLPRSQEIRIGNHVWLGEEARLLGNASIGDGSVLGAFSVLAGSIPANCIAVGNPARVVRDNRTWSRSDVGIDRESMSYIDSLPSRGGVQGPG